MQKYFNVKDIVEKKGKPKNNTTTFLRFLFHFVKYQLKFPKLQLVKFKFEFQHFPMKFKNTYIY